MCKKIFLVIGVIVIFISIILTGCQATPKNDIVVGKSGSTIQDQIEQSGSNNEGNYLNVQKNWKEQISHNGESLDIIVDANIITPSVLKYPIMEIKPAVFTENQIEELLSYFMKDNIGELYDENSPLTKSQLEEMIIEAKGNLAKASNPDLGLPAETELMQFIADLEKQYADAPEVNEKNFIPIKLGKEQGSEYETFNALCDLGKKEPARILVMNGNEDDLSSIFCFDNGALYAPNSDLYGKQANGLRLTRDEAAKKVEKQLQDMDFADMKIVKVDTGENLNSQTNENTSEQGYQVTCVRWVNEIPVLPFERFWEVQYKNDYIAKWYDQKMIFMVDDSGITSFRWLDYGSVQNAIVESSELLPFEKIQEIFRNNIYLLNASLDESLAEYFGTKQGENEEHGEITSFKVVVDSIQLGYITQPQKNKAGEFMLVPAWFFYGYNEQTMSDGSVYKNYLASGTSSCQMIINALDGTLVE